MKLRPPDPVLQIGMLFLGLFSFVSTLLIFKNPGLNENTFIGLLILCCLALVGNKVLKRESPKHKKYERVFAFVVMPALAALAGIVIAVK
ncbi:MAG: hypothetical protein ACJA2E_001082 [Arenicella sp.]|jgi:hypothetical protein